MAQFACTICTLWPTSLQPAWRRDLQPVQLTQSSCGPRLSVPAANSLLAVSLPSGAESPMPVLRVYASAQPDDLSEEEQARVVFSAGVAFEIPLRSQSGSICLYHMYNQYSLLRRVVAHGFLYPHQSATCGEGSGGG